MPNGDDHDLLQRIDERVQLMRVDVQCLRDEVKADHEGAAYRRTECAKTFAEMFVTHQEFDPVRRVVYGTVATILLSVLTVVIGMAVHG